LFFPTRRSSDLGRPACRWQVRRLFGAREGSDFRAAARTRPHPQAATRPGAREAGAAVGALKRQNGVSLLTRAESRVYPRTGIGRCLENSKEVTAPRSRLKPRLGAYR